MLTVFRVADVHKTPGPKRLVARSVLLWWSWARTSRMLYVQVEYSCLFFSAISFHVGFSKTTKKTLSEVGVTAKFFSSREGLLYFSIAYESKPTDKRKQKEFCFWLNPFFVWLKNIRQSAFSSAPTQWSTVRQYVVHLQVMAPERRQSIVRSFPLHVQKTSNVVAKGT